MNLDAAFETFRAPEREFGVIPFWFWNDDVNETELIRQLHEFHTAGFGGVLPHARIGLSHRVGYLTEEFFRLMRIVVQEAARLDMKIILYDEGSYPSGSARGEVVKENHEYASQAIALWQKDVTGPFHGFWRPNTGRALLDRHVCTFMARSDGDETINPDTLVELTSLPNDIFRIEVDEGTWKVMSVWNVCSGGHIRGVFPEEEDGHASAPPSADILNPEAVSRFIELVHERYYSILKEFFGNTIIALFTDEPGVMGRGGGQRGQKPKPYTPGFLDWIERRHGRDPRPWLPSLWIDYGSKTDEFRALYATAVEERLQEVFYAAQSEWCADHNIALTGHPAGSTEMSALRRFQLPGQDTVWRWVLPNESSALEGAHSVSAKAATSGARAIGARRILTECGGAYGWRMTLDETKWLFDWHLVRGNNLLNPHAAFYSIRERRAWESEPDIGVHNVWWPYYKHIAIYGRRLSWLLSDGEHVVSAAILGNGNNLPWRAAKQLYQSQIDFLYIDNEAVESSECVGGSLQIGKQRYPVIIIEGNPLLSEKAKDLLKAFKKNGGRIVEYTEDIELPAAVNAVIPREVIFTPPCKDLRIIHYQKNALDFFFLVNEGENDFSGMLALNVVGNIEIWDPFEGSSCAAPARKRGQGLDIEIEIGRRESVVVAVDTNVELTAIPSPPVFIEDVSTPDLDWKVYASDGTPVDIAAPGDWAECPGYELFSGTFSYRSAIDLTDAVKETWLDLGQIGDIAEILLDDEPIGIRLWAPYKVCLGRNLKGGTHSLEVKVTNSMANAFEGTQNPSGLMGPVRIISRTKSAGSDP